MCIRDRDLHRSGHVLELRELGGSVFVLSALSGSNNAAGANEEAQARIDRSWAVQILAGELSPLAALERRLGRPGPRPLESIQARVGARTLRRTDTRMASIHGQAVNETAGVVTV